MFSDANTGANICSSAAKPHTPLTKIHWLYKITGFGKIAGSFGVFLYKYTVFRLKDFGKYILETPQSAESAKVGNIWKHVFQVQNTSCIAMQNPCQVFSHILTGNIWKYGFARFFHLEKYVKPLERRCPKGFSGGKFWQFFIDNLYGKILYISVHKNAKIPFNP